MSHIVRQVPPSEIIARGHTIPVVLPRGMRQTAPTSQELAAAAYVATSQKELEEILDSYVPPRGVIKHIPSAMNEQTSEVAQEAAPLSSQSSQAS